jgi:hypothetical protein
VEIDESKPKYGLREKIETRQYQTNAVALQAENKNNRRERTGREKDILLVVGLPPPLIPTLTGIYCSPTVFLLGLL